MEDYNVKINLKYVQCLDVVKIHLSQNKVLSLVAVDTLINLSIPSKTENFLTICLIINFSRRTLLYIRS